MTKVLFVCLGNICRSPTAEAVFKKRTSKLLPDIIVDSAGTENWHVGRAADDRSCKAAARSGYDMGDLRARVVIKDDFYDFDYILAMDRQNLNDLEKLRQGIGNKPQLFMDFAADLSLSEIPDPYYGGDAGFSRVINMVEQASDGLIARLMRS